jgi:CDP-glycerol glycerophosphotransferase (TagB/SpsB family)
LHEYEIIYKLHPGEYDRWQTYNSLLKLKEYKNITIIDNNNIPLYQLLAESKFLVGAYSTVIFESLSFNCKIIIVDIPGIEHVRSLVDSGKAKLLKKGQKIAGLLKNN